MSIIDELIFDRTDEDLEVAKNYIKNNQPLPSDNLRYSWDCRALNRTEEAMEYVNEIFKELGYFRNMEFKTDWFADEITPKQSQRYISNLKTLRSYLVLPSDTPVAPNTINGMTIERANEIEKIIHDIDVVLEALQNNFVYSGVCGSGQNRIWQQRFRRKPYTRVKYLQSKSSARQYIDTGIKPNKNTDVEMKLEIMGQSTQRMFGVRNDNETYFFGQQASGNKIFFNLERTLATSYRVVSDVVGRGTGEHILKIQNGEFFVDGVSYGVSAGNNFVQSSNAFIFNTNATNFDVNGSYAKLYYCKIYDNNKLVRDFIPVLNYNNIPCLLDKVQNRFYYNQGTGDFIAGN